MDDYLAQPRDPAAGPSLSARIPSGSSFSPARSKIIGDRRISRTTEEPRESYPPGRAVRSSETIRNGKLAGQAEFDLVVDRRRLCRSRRGAARRRAGAAHRRHRERRRRALFVQLALGRRHLSCLVSRREAAPGRAESGNRARDIGRDRSRAGSGHRRGLRPRGRFSRGAGRAFHQRQPDLLAPLDAGAAARRRARPGLAGPRPRPDDCRAEGPARTAPGADVSRHAGDGAAHRGRTLHRGRGLARRRRSDLRGTRHRDRRWRFSRRSGAVPASYRPAAGACPAAPCRHRGRRRAAHGRESRRGADPARPVLRPSVEPRRDARRRAVAVSADRRGRDRRRSSSIPAAGGCSTRGSAAFRSRTTWPGSTTRSARR